MIIKPATAEMMPQLMDLSGRYLANAAGVFGSVDMNALVAELWRLMNDRFKRIFVAVEQGQILGLHIVSSDLVFFAPSVRVARTVTMWVDPDHRGRGIGTQLQESAESWAKWIGARFMSAGVPFSYDAQAVVGDRRASADQAEAFYEGRGYERAETSFLKEVT